MYIQAANEIFVFTHKKELWEGHLKFNAFDSWGNLEERGVIHYIYISDKIVYSINNELLC